MSKLEQETSDFKAVLKRQNFKSWHSQPRGTPVAAVASTSTPAAPPPEVKEESTSPNKKKRPKTNIVYSQPVDTGTGMNVNTQLVYAVNHLKSTQNPMRLQDIAIITNTPLDTDLVLLEKFRGHDRIQYDSKTDLYSYKHDFTFRNKGSLLNEIQRQTRKGGGLSVRLLKESWKEAGQAIEELEKEGEVLVTRTTKDGQLRMVFWNEIKPTDEAGGKRVDQEFLDLWHDLKVPNEVDLQRELANEGLQVTAAESSAPSATQNGKKKGKRGGAPRQRQVRITNTHLKGEIDLSKNYVAPGK
ncbi:transcription initiation factor IIE subunit beta [Coprinopsis marcescibilis]|uniref:Transcription initiation factor IIE subunit beta n=1 Tax=Coprinopsis marcescibilis TaxID=230819 RepID=A0A5C3LAY6_COPMA|nr:transcription initiation factor IIE subunit beta [Coprinopsis marcescibilis]